MTLWIVLLLAFQDAEARQARELVEQLRSDRIEERDKATRSLKALGRAAYPAVREALRDPDAEVASRAAAIFPVLTLALSLPPRLMEEIPDALEAIAARKEGAWTAAFFEALQTDDGRPRHPKLTHEDLVPLARSALREPTDEKGVRRLCRMIVDAKLVELKPGLRDLLSTADVRDHGEIQMALVGLGDNPSREQVQTLLRVVRYGGHTRSTAIQILAKLRLKETAPDLIRVAFEEEEGEPVVEALLAMERRAELLEAARKLLREPPVQAAGLVPVRPRAALLVARLGTQEDLPLLKQASKDADEQVARIAGEALQNFKSKE